MTVTLLLLCLLKAQPHVTVMQIMEVRRENFETSCVRIIPDGSIYFEGPAPMTTRYTAYLHSSFLVSFLSSFHPGSHASCHHQEYEDTQSIGSLLREWTLWICGWCCLKIPNYELQPELQFWIWFPNNPKEKRKIVADYSHNQEHNADLRTYHRSLATRESEWVLSSW